MPDLKELTTVIAAEIDRIQRSGKRAGRSEMTASITLLATSVLIAGVALVANDPRPLGAAYFLGELYT